LLSPERRRRSQVLLGRIPVDASSIDDEDGNHDGNVINKLSLRVLSHKRELLLDNMESLNRLLVSKRLSRKCLFTNDDDDDLDSDYESDLED
jgi:hypothetical protein